MSSAYILTFIEGILTFISPCILPLLPVYFIYLAGEKKGHAASEIKKNSLLINSLGFVIGFTLIFVILGATASSIGYVLAKHRSLLEKISGVAIILFGLNYLGIIKLAFLNKGQQFDIKIKGLKFLSSIVFGMVFSLGWTPCLGAFLGSALALASNSKTIFEGVLLLLLYSMGLGIPFVMTAALFDKLKGVFEQLKTHSKVISIISGILLILAGILVYTGSLKYINF